MSLAACPRPRPTMVTMSTMTLLRLCPRPRLGPRLEAGETRPNVPHTSHNPSACTTPKDLLRQRNTKQPWGTITNLKIAFLKIEIRIQWGRFLPYWFVYKTPWESSDHNDGGVSNGGGQLMASPLQATELEKIKIASRFRFVLVIFLIGGASNSGVRAPCPDPMPGPHADVFGRGPCIMASR